MVVLIVFIEVRSVRIALLLDLRQELLLPVVLGIVAHFTTLGLKEFGVGLDLDQ